MTHHIVLHSGKPSGLNGFANEVARSNWEYPDEYKIAVGWDNPIQHSRAKPIIAQVKQLSSIFGVSGREAFWYITHILPTLLLPPEAEGWFATLAPEAFVAERFPRLKTRAERFCATLALLQKKLDASRSFYNYRDREINPRYLQMEERTQEAYQQITKIQTGCILIIPAQLGLGHRGCSVRMVHEHHKENEFGLDSVAMSSILLTHPERELRQAQLHVDCPGDKFDPSGDNDFNFGTYFFVDVDGELEFRAYNNDEYSASFGSATSFLVG